MPSSRVDARKAIDAFFFVLSTGCQRNTLNKTGSRPHKINEEQGDI